MYTGPPLPAAPSLEPWRDEVPEGNATRGSLCDQPSHTHTFAASVGRDSDMADTRRVAIAHNNSVIAGTAESDRVASAALT